MTFKLWKSNPTYFNYKVELKYTMCYKAQAKIHESCSELRTLNVDKIVHYSHLNSLASMKTSFSALVFQDYKWSPILVDSQYRFCHGYKDTLLSSPQQHVEQADYQKPHFG